MNYEPKYVIANQGKKSYSIAWALRYVTMEIKIMEDYFAKLGYSGHCLNNASGNPV